MVDGILLLVDAADGPMPQTRYVLSKALERHLPAVVVINKVDRPDARPKEVADEVYELFFDLDAKDHHIDFPIVSTVARTGRPSPESECLPRIGPVGPARCIVDTIPAPSGDPGAPIQALVTNLDASDYLGRLAIGRVFEGTLRHGSTIALCHANEEEPDQAQADPVVGILRFESGRDPEVSAGDLFVVAGFPEVEIGTPSPTWPTPSRSRLIVDEPVLKMTFGVNTSPLSGRDGKFLTRADPGPAPAEDPGTSPSASEPPRPRRWSRSRGVASCGSPSSSSRCAARASNCR